MCIRDRDKIEVQKYRALYLDAQLKENPVVLAVKDKSFKSLVRNMTVSYTHLEYKISGILWKDDAVSWIFYLKFVSDSPYEIGRAHV